MIVPKRIGVWREKMIRSIRNLMVILITICNISILSAQEIKTPDENLTKGYIVIDGSKLDYVVRGNGISCLIIGSSVYYPKAFSHDLDKYMKIYFVDMKWFAKDYKPEKLDSVTIQSIVEDVEEIRNKLQRSYQSEVSQAGVGYAGF